MKTILTLLLFCSISFISVAQVKVSSVSKTIQLQADSLSKSKVSDRKRIHLVDNSGSYTGEYMMLSYQDEVMKEYDLYGANNLRKGKVKQYANGEILTFDIMGVLTQKETTTTVIKK